MLRRASHGLCCIFTWLCCAAVVIGCVAVPCRWLPWSHHWRPGPHLLQVHLRCRVRTLHARHSSRALPVREPCPPVPSVGASWLPVSYGGVFCCWDFFAAVAMLPRLLHVSAHHWAAQVLPALPWQLRRRLLRVLQVLQRPHHSAQLPHEAGVWGQLRAWLTYWRVSSEIPFVMAAHRPGQCRAGEGRGSVYVECMWRQGNCICGVHVEAGEVLC